MACTSVCVCVFVTLGIELYSYSFNDIHSIIIVLNCNDGGGTVSNHHVSH